MSKLNVENLKNLLNNIFGNGLDGIDNPNPHSTNIVINDETAAIEKAYGTRVEKLLENEGKMKPLADNYVSATKPNKNRDYFYTNKRDKT